MTESSTIVHTPPEPRDRLLRLVLLAIAIASILGLWLSLSRGGLPATGGDAPALTFAMLDGEKVELEALRGEVVVLDFWATWCPPCVESMPVVRKVGAELAPRGVRVIAVNGDQGDAREALVRRFLERHGLAGLPVALDDGGAARAFAITGLPTLVVLGRDGKVAGTHLGAIDEAELRALIEAALRGA